MNDVNKHNLHLPRNLEQFPEYAQKYPSLQRKHLCDVKRGIHYPNLPSFRHIERDNALHKLPDEHCRNTTLCNPECFEDIPQVEKPFRKYQIASFDKFVEKYSFAPQNLVCPELDILKVCPKERRDWKDTLAKEHSEELSIYVDPHLKAKTVTSGSCDSCHILRGTSCDRYKSWNAAAMPDWYVQKY
ncbi:uncharacterized protein [Parasteatoda tepidariorum]|uniref:uncharacterized protein n=1 Tax=Parasteatoda tepidariorum TaxID=114398 RepID=UPI0039BCC133